MQVAGKFRTRPHATPNHHGGRAVNITTAVCKCGHSLSAHHYGDCVEVIDDAGRFCKCREFSPVKKG